MAAPAFVDDRLVELRDVVVIRESGVGEVQGWQVHPSDQLHHLSHQGLEAVQDQAVGAIRFLRSRHERSYAARVNEVQAAEIQVHARLGAAIQRLRQDFRQGPDVGGVDRPHEPEPARFRDANDHQLLVLVNGTRDVLSSSFHSPEPKPSAWSQS